MITLVGTEFFLRSYFGFCHTVLFQHDPDLEYIQQSNQDVLRFRKRSKYNAYSMRNDELEDDSVKILGFGDSVLNGGVSTEQDSLATNLLSNELTKIYNKKTQFLNIAAGSWGPDNCYAYLKKYGDFGAKSLVLFVSSHDAYDNRDFKKTVGVHKSYPDKQESFAFYELFGRYVFPRILKLIKLPTNNEDDLLINKKIEKSTFNSGFKDFYNYTKQNRIKYVIYLHADTQELKEGKYNEQGEEIIQFAKDNNVLLIKDLDNDLKEIFFRDGIHLNEKGQKNMYKTIMKFEKNLVSNE